MLLLTFTRRAAADMLARAAVLCGDRRAAGKLWGGTFHAVAHRLISMHAETLGLPNGLSVLDPADARDLMDLLRHDHGLSGAGTVPGAVPAGGHPGRCVLPGGQHRPARPSRHRGGVPVVRPAHRQDPRPVPRATSHANAPAGCSTSTTCLLGWRSLLSDATLGPTMAARWDHVLVDEYQDVNQVQVDIVRLLRPDGVGLTVVGDDAQAIYGFRGADAAHLTDLATTLPGATVVRLERNFRSRQPLLDLANAVRPAGELALRLHSDRHGRRRARGWSAATTRPAKPAWSPTPSWRRSRPGSGCATRRC